MDNQGPIEAALTTDLRGKPYNFSLWDIYTGAQLVVFKGSSSNPIPKCIQLIDNNYFITATDNVLQIWSIFNRKCQDTKLFLPARPSTLCTSPCGNYLIVGISEMIYIWQLTTGNLLAHAQRHYQTVSVVKLNRDGSFLFSGGEDGIVLVWPFADLISNTHYTGAMNLPKSRQDVGINEPRFTWQHHNSQVTDIHITNGGLCISVSADCTVNIYSYSCGKRLYCVTMPSPLWSVVMNKNETSILLGAQDGNIYEIAVSSISLCSPPGDESEANGASKKPMLAGHKGKVISLVISTDGTRLISASLDSTCKIWDLANKKLLQDIKHQAPLANLTSLLVPDSLALSSMSQSQAKPPFPVRQLKRNVYKLPRDGVLASEDLFEEGSTTIINVKNQVNRWELITKTHVVPAAPPNIASEFTQLFQSLEEIKGMGNIDNEPNLLVEKYKERMKALYLLSAEKIFKDAAHESLKPFKP